MDSKELLALKRLAESPFHNSILNFRNGNSITVGEEIPADQTLVGLEFDKNIIGHEHVIESKPTKIGNPSGSQGIETIIGIGLSDGFDFGESVK